LERDWSGTTSYFKNLPVKVTEQKFWMNGSLTTDDKSVPVGLPVDWENLIWTRRIVGEM